MILVFLCVVIVANWKMNGSFREIDAFISGLKPTKKVVLCLPFVFLSYLFSLLQKNPNNFLTSNSQHNPIEIGAQDCSRFSNGPYTGEVSASMLNDVGCKYVILGHYERRNHHNETNEIIQTKIISALSSNLIPILCIGEKNPENKKIELKNQLSCLKKSEIYKRFDENNIKFIIAYEPIYALGGTESPPNEELKKSIDIIRDVIECSSGILPKILYGGAVDELNANRLMQVDGLSGLLIGRSSMDYKRLNTIISSISA